MAVAVTVDLVVFTIRHDQLCVLLVRRRHPPFARRWALPGGFVEEHEGLVAAARRELAEETGLGDPHVHLEQLATYGDPHRDPRGRVVTVAYLALATDLPDPAAGSDAAEARWLGVDEVLAKPRVLAFDHGVILRDGLERARARLEHSPLAPALCAGEFTVAELRRAYELVWGVPLDPRNFHRKVTGAAGFLAATERSTTRTGGRPAQLYRAGPASVLDPPMARP
jgi:8-oxo-dGTP diphosphatase